MKRGFAFCVVVVFLNIACGLHKQSQTSESTNQPVQAAKESPAKPEAPTTPGELQPGQASGTYTAKGEVVELKYSYAGRAERFGTDSLVVLVTDKPIPPEALAEEIKSATLLEGEKIRGLEYVFDDNGMWVRYHPSQYQESSSNKLKEYKVENGIVRGIDDNAGNLSDGKYARSVKFVAAIAK
ncbi:MAG TPA: hypothetical protein VJ784_11345 [Pyrinomonadaceae bacterium]|jgi:hypothetical protein|nr:hypothetical protein [Pyrinomonadaceae bacterium]